MALYGLTRLGPSLPASDFVSPSTFSPLQGCAHFNLLSLVNEEVHTGLSLSLRSLARVGASVAVLSASHQDSHLAFRSLARCELSLSVLNLATFSLPMTFRSMACASTFLSVFICARFDKKQFVTENCSLSSRVMFGIGVSMTLVSPVEISSYAKLCTGQEPRGDLSPD